MEHREHALSHLDMCLYILKAVRRDGYTPREWQFNREMWQALANEARPEYITGDSGPLSLFGVPVDVSLDHPGVTLRII